MTAVLADCGGYGDCRTFLGNAILGSSLTVSGTATPPAADVSEPTDLAVLSCVGSTGSRWGATFVPAFDERTAEQLAIARTDPYQRKGRRPCASRPLRVC